jgi:hypothetical protein
VEIISLEISVHSSATTMAVPGVDEHEIQLLFTDEEVMVHDLEDEAKLAGKCLSREDQD